MRICLVIWMLFWGHMVFCQEGEDILPAIKIRKEFDKNSIFYTSTWILISELPFQEADTLLFMYCDSGMYEACMTKESFGITFLHHLNNCLELKLITMFQSEKIGFRRGTWEFMIIDGKQHIFIYNTTKFNGIYEPIVVSEDQMQLVYRGFD
ncbi:MAG: hypothetical protein MRY83_03760 [Flavobacteriales bacterium]|nr:hypothetical protein [Flavobacteriales bacterium]